MERQMYSLSVLACAHMHRTGTRGCVQHGEDIVLGDAALTVFQLRPRLHCSCLVWREIVTTPQWACVWFAGQLYTHMYDTCCSMCAGPLETFSPCNKFAKLTTYYSFICKMHYFGSLNMASTASDLCLFSGCRHGVAWTDSIRAMN